MLGIGNPMVWLVGVLWLAVVWFLLRGRFSAQARERRRREKSHRRAISRKKGPTVKLAVNVDQSKRERSGPSGD